MSSLATDTAGYTNQRGGDSQHSTNVLPSEMSLLMSYLSGTVCRSAGRKGLKRGVVTSFAHCVDLRSYFPLTLALEVH